MRLYLILEVLDCAPLGVRKLLKLFRRRVFGERRVARSGVAAPGSACLMPAGGGRVSHSACALFMDCDAALKCRTPKTDMRGALRENVNGSEERSWVREWIGGGVALPELNGERVSLRLDLFDRQVISLSLAHNLLLHPRNPRLQLFHVVSPASLVLWRVRLRDK